MNNESRHIKLTSESPEMVITAKVSEGLFEKIETFRRDNGLETRNATLNVLILLGLCRWEKLDQNEYLRFLRSQDAIHISDHLLNTLSLTKGAV